MGKNNTPYFSLWLLLFIALSVVVGFSFIEDKTTEGLPLKKAPFKETLLASAPVEENEMVYTPQEIEEEPEPLIIETDSLPKNIFLFGDSMTLNIALRMAEYAAENGHSFHAINWDASNTKLWAESDTLSYYIRQYKPDYIFVSLGSNEVYFKNPEVRAPFIKKIIEEIGDIPMVWIGPPNWNNDTGINDLLASLCGPGRFFKSEGIELKRKSDNIHPTRKATIIWVDSLMRWMENSAHPILTHVPSDSLGHVKTNVKIIKASYN